MDFNNTSKAKLLTSYALQGMVTAMLVMGAMNNLLQTDMAMEGAASMGFDSSTVVYLGVICLISAILYALPKTSILGAMLVTGWLGGAVAAHMINKDELVMTLFPVIFGCIVWLALWLRDARLQRIIPLKN